MAERDQSDPDLNVTSKNEPAQNGESANPKGDRDSEREGQANSERSTASRPRGHTEDPDRTL